MGKKQAASATLGMDPKATATIPAEQRFALAGGGDDHPADFIDAPELDAIAHQLIEEADNFIALRESEARIKVLWRRQGGKSQGRDTLGKATKVGGLVAHFSRVDFLIWIAADHARELELTNRQVEALVFHELLHCVVRYEDSGTFGTIGHDFEFFGAEIERYGLWRRDLERARDACMQRSLFEAEE